MPTSVELLIPEFGAEMASTRRVLAAVPDAKFDWKPHEKSMSIGSLASHLAELPWFGTTILTTPELDFAANPYTSRNLPTTAARLESFDKLAGEMRSLIERADWATLQDTWKLRMGDHVLLDAPKGTLLRTLTIAHMSHHRAQLSVYLRLRGVAVPGSYGPSADEM